MAAETGADRSTLLASSTASAPSTFTNRSRKRLPSPAVSEVSIRPPGKKQKLVEPTAAAPSLPPLDIGAYSSLVDKLVQLVPQLAQMSSSSGVSYSHHSLATSEDFRVGLPAQDFIPAKEPTGSRRVHVKRLPAWTLEPELKTFGPYFKANGVDYSPADISTLARSIPDVRPFFF